MAIAIRLSVPAHSSHTNGFPRIYTAEEVQYFSEIALGSEYGGSSERVRKWDTDVLIAVHGHPTASDRQTLEKVIAELNEILRRPGTDAVTIKLVSPEDVANTDIYFVPHSQFFQYEPNYQPGNMGFAYIRWRNDRIYSARILISSERLTQAERNHLIREELTQSLGLLRDSFRYGDSIFYQGWTSTNSFSAMDKAIIELLYSQKITPRMDLESIKSLSLNPGDRVLEN